MRTSLFANCSTFLFAKKRTLLFAVYTHLLLPDWKVMKFVSIGIWCITGYLTTTIWMAVGYAVAPTYNKTVKWVLLLPLILIMLISLLATIAYGNMFTYNVPMSSINGKLGQILLTSVSLLTSFGFIWSSPSDKLKINFN